MTTQAHGIASILDPPVLFSGKLFGLGIQYTPPAATTLRPVIVQGQIQRVEDLGGNYKRIVCRRGYQYSSYTKTYGAGDSIELVYPVLTGGNIVQTPEPARVLSHANPMATRGTDAGSRATIGDLFEVSLGSVAVGSLITDVEAYAEPGEDGVNYNGEAPPPLVTTKRAGSILVDDDRVDLNSLAIIGEAGATYLLENDGLFSGCGVVWVSESTQDFATRRIFNSDPNDYPDNASFSASIPEYWINPGGGGVRLSSSWASVSPVSAQLRYWAQGIAAATDAYGFVMDQSAGTGHGSATDDIVLAAFAPSTASFTQVLQIDAGAGFVEWRSSALANSACIQLTFDASGNLTGAGARLSNGGTYSSATPSGSGYAAPFLVRVLKSGATVSIAVAEVAETPSWTTAVSFTMDAAHTNDAGFVGVSATPSGGGVKWSNQEADGLLDASLMFIGSATARLSAFRVVFSDFAAADLISLEDDKTLDRVYNVTTGEAMVPGGALARNAYGTSGDQLVIRAETFGDEIRIEYEPDGEAPPGPGRPPRTFNQKNFATFAEGGEEATTDPAENVANNQDVLIVYDEHDELGDLPTGTAFRIYRANGPVFDPRTPPTIQIDWREGSGDWRTVPTSEIVARWAMGWVLVSKDYVDANTDGTAPCVKARGKTFRQLGILANVHNLAAKSVEVLDQLWVDAGTTGGDIGALSGFGGKSMGPTGWECCGGFPIPSGAMYGVSKGELEDFADQIGWYFEDGRLIYFDNESGSSYSTAEIEEVAIDCNPEGETDPDKIRTEAGRFVAETIYSIQPYHSQTVGTVSQLLPWWGKENYYFDDGDLEGDAVPAATNYFWAYPNVLTATDRPAGGYNCAFSFQGIAFNPASWFRYLPDGAVILEAKMRVKFNGIRTRSWAMNYSNNGTDGEHYTYTDQGVLVREKTPSRDWFITDDLILPPEPTKGGSVAFNLVGARVRTSRVQLISGEFLDYPASTFASIGAVPASSVVDGKWSLVDVTGAMAAVLSDRDSARSQYYLWPTTGAGNPGSSVYSLSSYLLGLAPTWSAAISYGDGCDWGYEHSAAGRVTWFSTLQTGGILLRYRLPSGQTGHRLVPAGEPQSI